MDQLRADMEHGDMTLDQRLGDMGLDPAEYKRYRHVWSALSLGSNALTSPQPLEKPASRKPESGSVGAPDARGRAATVEANADNARPFDATTHVQKGRCGANQGRKVRLPMLIPS